MISILILAAGQSARMRGGDKLLEDVGGQPCLSHLVHCARATGFDTIAVVPHLDHPRAAAAHGARIVPSPDADQGMAHSLRAGLNALPKMAEAVIILPGDMPEITSADLLAVAQAHLDSGKGIVQAATSDHAPGHPTLFARRYFPLLDQLSGDSGAREVIDAHRDDRLLLPLSDDRARLDLDTPEDWDNWRARKIRDQSVSREPDL